MNRTENATACLSLHRCRDAVAAVPLRGRGVALVVVSLLVGSLAVLPGCASRGSDNDDSEDRRPAQATTQRTLADMDERFVHDLNEALLLYRTMLSRHDVSEAKVSAERNRVRTLSTAYRDAMIEALQGRGDRAQRRVSAAALGFVAGPTDAVQVVPVLLDAIPNRAREPIARTDEALGITFYALIGLAELGRAGALYVYPQRDEVLKPIAALVRDTMPDIRSVAIEAFGYALTTEDDPDWLDALTLRLAEENDPRVRKLIVDALGNVGDRRGYEAILSFALKDANPEVREDAVVALGRSLHPDYIEPLIGMLDDPAPAVRMQTLAMLKRMRRHQDRVSELSEAVAERLYDRDPNVRERAILALGDLGDTGKVLDLIRMLGDRREGVRHAAIISLGKLRDERAIPPLIEMLTAREDNIRNAARRSLVLITAHDLGADASAWQSWDESGRPPVTGRTDPRFATEWGEIDDVAETGEDSMAGTDEIDEPDASEFDPPQLPDDDFEN